jgi:hypothetical protein
MERKKRIIAAVSSPAARPAPAPFRGPAADSVLGERFIDVIGIVAAMGFAAEVSQCLYLCGETWRKGDKGATNDMLARSLERQCGARAARAAAREDFAIAARPGEAPYVVRGSTQLVRAAFLNNLPRVLQLVQLGAALDAKTRNGDAALHWACEEGHVHVVRALLDGKYEQAAVVGVNAGVFSGAGAGAGVGASVELRGEDRMTPLMTACGSGRLEIARLLLARGARVAPQSSDGFTALHATVISASLLQRDDDALLRLLLAAPDAAAALPLRTRKGFTALDFAESEGLVRCAAALRELAAKGGRAEEAVIAARTRSRRLAGAAE